jgi:hypothetical protein
LKKTHFYWILNKEYSLFYYNSLQYRESISLLTNVKRQLTLDLSDCSEIVDVNTLSDVFNFEFKWL